MSAWRLKPRNVGQQPRGGALGLGEAAAINLIAGDGILEMR